ncbi:MAG: L-seryl-tRNA(Sec) selenium transferase [Actinomycetota bacterium]
MSSSGRENLSNLPQVDRLIDAMGDQAPHALRAEAARRAVGQARAAALEGLAVPAFEEILASARRHFRMTARRRLVRVINATGVLLHTNLGRAPLGNEAVRAMERISTGYSNLEYDLSKAGRGSRYDHAKDLLVTLTGAEDALVVNNNAAAVLLALSALSRGGEVVISRGELIEIGGEFRIPEILSSSGAVLKEVGTTNRTHLKDYERAIGPATAAIMKVHPSNYRILGFVASVPARDLATLAHHHGLPFIHDVGGGLLRPRIGGVQPSWLAAEPSVQEAVAEGADVLSFSGDKLLGGPQAGMIVGRAEAISAMAASPLLRTYRVDKTTLAALEATLLAYVEGREAELPLWRMALSDASEIEARAGAAADALAAAAARVSLCPGSSATGGGSAPGAEIPTVLLELTPLRISAAQLQRCLVDHDPAIVARIEADKVLLDLRTVSPEDDGTLLEALSLLLEQ